MAGPMKMRATLAGGYTDVRVLMTHPMATEQQTKGQPHFIQNLTVKVNGKVVATKRMERTLPMILQWDESFDIGSDTLTGVNDADYKPPFPLTAKLIKLTIKVDRPQLSPEDIKKLEAAMQEKAKRD